jgi:hypothetical protein
MQSPQVRRVLVGVLGTLVVGATALATWGVTQGVLSVDLVSFLATVVAAVLGLSAATQEWQARSRRAAESERINQRSIRAARDLEQALKKSSEPAGEDDSLVLASLWAAVDSRLEQYHDDAQSQGRRAFTAAMTAMWIGFVLLVASGIVAATAQGTTAPIVVGSLGGVSAAAAGYIARTFLRAYEGTSRHLRGYFLHPVEMSRYLSAERLIAQSGLSSEVQADLMRVLVHSMATGALAERAEQPAAVDTTSANGRPAKVV